MLYITYMVYFTHACLIYAAHMVYHQRGKVGTSGVHVAQRWTWTHYRRPKGTRHGNNVAHVADVARAACATYVPDEEHLIRLKGV